MKVRSTKLNVAMECSLLGEQEQSHSAGTDIVQIMVYGIYKKS